MIALKRLACSVALLSFAWTGIGYAGTLADDFSSNPFGVGGFWCERWHDVSYSPTSQLMLLRGTTVCSGSPCCGACSEGCSTAPGVAAFAITKPSMEGTTGGRDRTASAKWSIPTPNLDEGVGEHPVVFAIAHPNCHAGVEASVFREGSVYRLKLLMVNDNTPGYQMSPYWCDGLFVNSWSSTGTAPLVLQSTPRYVTNVRAYLPNSAPSLYGLTNASVTDSQTGSVLLSITSKSFTAPLWFNNHAKRYGVGAVRKNTSSQIPFDDFLGVSF